MIQSNHKDLSRDEAAVAEALAMTQQATAKRHADAGLPLLHEGNRQAAP